AEQPAPAPVQPVAEVPSIVRETARPDPSRAEREFYTDVRFPQQVRVGDELPLIVRLTRAPYAASRVTGEVGLDFDRPDKPEYVEVVVIAAGFNEGTATWNRSIAVYSNRDSQPAIFLLRAGRELGDKRVTIDFYHKDRYLGSAAFVTRVVEQTPPAVAGVTVDTVGLVARFLETPPPPADLELRIVRGGSDNILSFMLHSTKPGIGYHWRPMGQVRLNAANPQAYLQTIFAHLSQVAAKPADRLSEADAQVDQGQLDAIGQQLFHELFPAELQHEYWTRIHPRRKDASNPKGSIATLLITSDEPWIPWEMVKPYLVHPDTGQIESDGFLSETFQVARWLAGRSPAEAVQVQRAGFVVSGHDLVYTEREEAYFRDLTARQVEVVGPLRQAAEVRKLAQEGSVQLLHFAAHGRLDASNANLSPLSLEDGPLTPYDLAGARVAGLRRDRPLVFLNACHTARLAFTLTGLGGWVERMVGDIGVSAFVGTLWEVNDLLAAEFAIHFYNRLLAGDTLGQAFHAARLQIRDRQPANPTWLAYVLYGDPNSMVRWGIGEPAAEEPIEETPMEPPLLPAPEPPLDVDELRAMLEESLVGLLPELIRVGIPDAVAEAIQRLREQPERNRNGAHTPATQEAPSEPAGAEPPPGPEPPTPPPAASTGGEGDPGAAG
ncbi:MAG TPA: CHAT domain-containing protein, partial [Caldilineaceae bacterium]|nr:CHAT domain-containing protein [Caldilineaceae bacterium]